MTAQASRPARFVAVGAGGFAVQIATLALLTAWARLPHVPATVLAVEAAILHNFLWHERWTWRDRQDGTAGRLARLARINGLAAAISIAGNVMLTSAFVEGLGVPLLAANAAAVVLLSGLTYRALDRWVYGNVGWRRAARAAGVITGMALAWGPSAHAGAGAGPVEAPSAAPPSALSAAPSATMAAWVRYVRVAEARIDASLAAGRPFFALDDMPDGEGGRLRAATLRGETPILSVTPESGDESAIPGGMVHHWRGWTFVPHASLDEVLHAAIDPTGHRQDDVLEARVLSRTPDGLRLFLKLQRRQSFVTASYNTEHEVRYRRHGRDRASSRSVAVRIRELDGAGTPAERERPVGEDRGFLWGMRSYWRYQAVNGGVLVELESITLSRGVPWGAGTLVRPLITRVARESLVRTLVAVRARVGGPVARG